MCWICKRGEKEKANCGRNFTSARQWTTTSLYAQYKSDSKRRTHKVIFTLSKEEFDILINSNCYYCGIPPCTPFSNWPKRNGREYDFHLRNGIDRRDNNIGYTPENSVPCCKICNRAKSDMKYKDFIEWIKLAYKHIYKKGD